MARKKKDAPEIVDMSTEEAEAMLERIRPALAEKDFTLIKRLVETVVFLLQVLEGKTLSIKRLRRLLFGAKTESSGNVLGGKKGKNSKDTSKAKQKDEKKKDEKKKRKGHGRNGASKYVGAEVIFVPIEHITKGDPCPYCPKGRVTISLKPAVIVRIRGQPPIVARIYELERLRCNSCGAVIMASLPEGVGETKYDETAGAVIGLLKYGYGVPLKRLEMIQENMGVPLPAGTQWDIIDAAAGKMTPVFRELVRLAAQGQLVQNDDTKIKILDLMREKEADGHDEKQDDEKEDSRSPFANCIVAETPEHVICLFLSGPKHAGEALAEVMEQRDPGLDPPTQMSDGHSRNTPKGHETVQGNCNAHARRKVVEVADSYPEQCEHVIDIYKQVYEFDAEAKKLAMKPRQRQQFHKEHSGPLMNDLHKWIKKQFKEKLVEPNSALGEALQYMLNRWDKLTLFLKRPGCPLDNNLTERCLKRVILLRKNALFYKTLHGAEVGDLYMSLFQTCRLADVNAFDYFVALLKHSKEVKSCPADWLPWNYQAALRSLSATS